MSTTETITHILTGDWRNELPPTSSLDYCGYTTEILWVGQDKKLIAFSHTFIDMGGEDDFLLYYETIGLGEALDLTRKEEEFIHKASCNNTKYPEGTEMPGIEVTWHRKNDPKSVQTLELYEHIREQFKSKEIKWGSGLFHILLGLLAAYPIASIKSHNRRVVGEYSEEDKKEIQNYHPDFERVFLNP